MGCYGLRAGQALTPHQNVLAIVFKRLECLGDKGIEVRITEARHCRHVFCLDLIQEGVRPTEPPDYNASHMVLLDSIDDLLLHVCPIGNAGVEFIVSAAVLTSCEIVESQVIDHRHVVTLEANVDSFIRWHMLTDEADYRIIYIVLILGQPDTTGARETEILAVRTI